MVMSLLLVIIANDWNVYFNQVETMLESRIIRVEQDKAYKESLAADHAKVSQSGWWMVKFIGEGHACPLC